MSNQPLKKPTMERYCQKLQTIFLRDDWKDDDNLLGHAVTILELYPELAKDVYLIDPLSCEDSEWRAPPLYHVLGHSRIDLKTVKVVYDMFPGAVRWTHPSWESSMLHEACKHVHDSSKDIIAFLVSKYPDAIRSSNLRGYLPLHYFAKGCSSLESTTITDICDMLWAGSLSYEDTRSNPSDTPLGIAIHLNCQPLIKHIISKIPKYAFAKHMRFYVGSMDAAKGLATLLPNLSDALFSQAPYWYADANIWIHLMRSLRVNTSITRLSLFFSLYPKLITPDKRIKCPDYINCVSAFQDLIKENVNIKELSILSNCDESCLHMDALLNGLQNRERTLDSLEIGCALRMTQLPDLFRLAPKTLILKNARFFTEHDPESGGLWRDGAFLGCRLKSLEISGGYLGTAAESQNSSFGNLRGDLRGRGILILGEAVLSTLKESRLVRLSVEFSLDISALCRHLATNTSMTTLSLKLSEDDYKGECQQLIDLLQYHNTTLTKVEFLSAPDFGSDGNADYDDSDDDGDNPVYIDQYHYGHYNDEESDDDEDAEDEDEDEDEDHNSAQNLLLRLKTESWWAMESKIRYYTLLNKYSRKRIRNLELDAAAFVGLLSTAMGDSLDSDIANGELSVLYGLLRELPSVWTEKLSVAAGAPKRQRKLKRKLRQLRKLKRKRSI